MTVFIHDYNMLGIRMIVGQTKFVGGGSIQKFKDTGITWLLQDIGYAWEPSHHTQWKALQYYTIGERTPLHRIKILNRDMGMQSE